MKRRLFGYKISDVNTIISALREENESLNATIAMLQSQIKNNIGEKNAKFLLLEDELETLKSNLLRANIEKEELLDQITSLKSKNQTFSVSNDEVAATIEEYDNPPSIPSVVKNSKTLYVGHNNYNVELINIDSNVSVTYKSTNNKVVSVNSKGFVKPISKGNAYIIVSISQNNKIYVYKVFISVKKTHIPMSRVKRSNKSLRKR